MKVNDFVTFPRTFENYRWYKPILVMIAGLIITAMLSAVIYGVFNLVFGSDFVESVMGGGYEVLTSPLAIFFTDLLIIVFIPALYLASKIVKDRPFSSYSSSRGGWNYKLYFKALVIPLILYIIFVGADSAVHGPVGPSNISISFIIILLLSVPLQCIAEEYIFRGFLLQTLGAWCGIPLLAIILQCIVFALGHEYNALGLLETLTSGLVLGFFTWKTDGIEVSSALHTANNFTLGLFVMLGLQASTSSPQLWDTALTIVFLIVLAVIMYVVGQKTDWFGEIAQDI